MSTAQTAINKAVEQFQAGRTDESKRLLMQSAHRFPGDLRIVAVLVEVLLTLGEFEPAAYWVERWTKAAPTDPAALLALVKSAIGRGKGDEAVAAARRMIAASPPGDHEPLRTLAWVLHRVKRFREAAEIAASAIELRPLDADLWQKRAVALQALGRVEESSEVYRRGSEACPESVELAEGAAMCANYQWDDAAAATGGESARAARAAHERFARLLERRQPRRERPSRRVIQPQERVRVGVVSPDLRRHSVGAYAEAIFRHVDRENIELFAYYTNPNEDTVTERLKALVGASQWRTIVDPSPERIEHAIRSDRLDLLLELSGLTVDHALDAIARKPAPVIATYIGYPNTTGLAAMDFRIVDSLTDPLPFGPAADRDVYCTERLIRIDPCFLCYTPHQIGAGGDVPDVSWRSPAERGTPIVFGSFNSLMKTNDRLLALWAQLLDRVPDSRLVLKAFGLGDDEVREDLLSRCVVAGIPQDRLELLRPPRGTREHLASYDLIDIGLDTFPYHGTTTTCEGMLMGLPVVSLAGSTHASRVGVSLLTAVGLEELIARSEDEYLEIAARLAADPARLATLRTGLRAQFLGSVVCDGPGYGRRLTSALLEMAGVRDVPPSV